MTEELKRFIEQWTKQVKEREELGIPPSPLSEKQVSIIAEVLLDPTLTQTTFSWNGRRTLPEALLDLLDHQVPPGVYPASKAKATFLGEILTGEKISPFISPMQALEMLGHMGGGANVPYIIQALSLKDDLAQKATEILSNTILISQEEFQQIEKLAREGNNWAKAILQSWAEGEWFAKCPPIPSPFKAIAVRTTGEINTDFLSPAQEASTRDDIPLHALKMLSTSPHDKDFLKRVQLLKEKGLPLVFVGDVVGTGSSRKSASNSLVWWIGEDIPHVPNKKRGGIVLAAKIAPIFFNTLRGCGAIPIRCSTSQIKEGDLLTIDFKEGVIKSEEGEVISHIQPDPPSILDEARAGGRNNLIIGRKLTQKAQQSCAELGIKTGQPALQIEIPSKIPVKQAYTLAQKLVGMSCKQPGILPGEYCEPIAHMVYSQDTTGKMTQQELLELACSKFATIVIQSFCHTAAGPKSKDSTMQNELGRFIAKAGGIDLRPGDGVIHTVGNRFLLPYFVGTGGDSHTRFPIGISFPAGSDLVAFAASQGYFPLDLPGSVLVHFGGKMQTGITVRDLVNAIPYVALQKGMLNLEQGDKKVNIFADRILEIQGLEYLTVEEAYKLTDASAERSAAAATFAHSLDQVISYVKNNLKFLKEIFAPRHPSETVKRVIKLFEEWLEEPKIFQADPGAIYDQELEVDLSQIKEPLLAAPNDPDKVITLSEAAGTPIDEVFIGSCMVDITDFRGAAAILAGETIPHTLKLWAVPPDRESNAQLAREGILSILMEAGANIHVPGCSLCMGNQAQVATNATVVSTSTRNFDNRMGIGAQVFLSSAYVAAVAALLGRIPTLEEYGNIFVEKVQPRWNSLSQPLRF
jgi:aconitate hydratase 2/2-methylisocitrate dehydratase